MKYLLYILLTLLTGCSLHTSIGNPEAQDLEARKGLQQLSQLLQQLAPQIDKAIKEEVQKLKDKK